jgi:hypothetical protein
MTSVFENAVPAAKDLCENIVTSRTVKIICVTPASVTQIRNGTFSDGSGTSLHPE